jgi:hypothetical protein
MYLCMTENIDGKPCGASDGRARCVLLVHDVDTCVK